MSLPCETLNIEEIKSHIQKIESEIHNIKNTGTSKDLIQARKDLGFCIKLLEFAEKRKSILMDLDKNKKFLSECDEELKELALLEKEELLEKFNLLKSDIKSFCYEPDSERNELIMEIRAGTGGQEATLFASSFVKMYKNFCSNHGANFQILNCDYSDLNGIRECVIQITGKDVCSLLMSEAGVHRVQRVPETEKCGRTHTSTVSVAILNVPTIDEEATLLKDDDLVIKYKRASGPGGQNVNKVSSAVVMTHLPTMLTVSCEDERSQKMNEKKARKILSARILELKEKETQTQLNSERVSQIGNASRASKIRTYNFNQNRVTDHQINYTTHNIQKFLDGEIDELVLKLLETKQNINFNKFEEFFVLE